MEAAGAYGGGKAGGAFDPQAFIQRPPVIVRAVCWLFSVIVMGCISAKGWYINKEDGKEYCVYNDDTNACNYGVGISVIAFVASIAFIIGEYLFEQMSSVKTRKHYVLADLGFSAFWGFLYFVGFCYLSKAWAKTDNPPIGTANNMQGAIAFVSSPFSLGLLARCSRSNASVWVLMRPSRRLTRWRAQWAARAVSPPTLEPPTSSHRTATPFLSDAFR